MQQKNFLNDAIYGRANDLFLIRLNAIPNADNERNNIVPKIKSYAVADGKY